MPNAWITHVKNYALQNNLKYSDALKDPACKASYKTGSGLTQSSEPVVPELNFPLTGRPLQRRNRGGRRINRVSAEPIDVPVAVQAQAEEIRGAIPVATRVRRNGRGIANMTRYGKPGTFSQDDVARIDKKLKERIIKPAVHSVTY